jgi:hypothetical protein
MTFLWPVNRQPATTVLGRLGRVLHWVLTTFAILAALVGALMLIQANTADKCIDPEGCEAAFWWAGRLRAMATQAFLAAAGAFALGRIGRYVLSGE